MVFEFEQKSSQNFSRGGTTKIFKKFRGDFGGFFSKTLAK
jgi:hypothetical protein